MILENMQTVDLQFEKRRCNSKVSMAFSWRFLFTEDQAGTFDGGEDIPSL